MRKYIVIEKEVGETPLMAIEKWRHAEGILNSLPLSYAGRLDPMASGKLLVLIGDECKQQEQYTKLDKEYEIEILLDISTDTGDVLGMPAYADTNTHPDKSAVKAALRAVTGTHVVPYPAFSSKTVNGKSLFLYALEGTLDTIEIPTHKETVYRIKQLGTASLSEDALQTRVMEMLSLAPRSDEPSKVLGADFRQDEIRARWGVMFASMPTREFVVLRLRVSCASGTYMRTLASRIARELGTTGFALSIRRTMIRNLLFRF
ncbi:MAG TPA: hypothetical protein VFY28_01110 [Candidatus Paceibacterota bacterium]|nr:hypothetical protein [Candidatus Paceibacterota bacterium]